MVCGKQDKLNGSYKIGLAKERKIMAYQLLFILFGVFLGVVVTKLIPTINKYTAIERKARLLLIRQDLGEIKDFVETYGNVLKEKTFEKLCKKIEELSIDDLINKNEDSLKVRIDSFENEKVQLKKLQAESFMETLETIKKMCVSREAR